MNRYLAYILSVFFLTSGVLPLAAQDEDSAIVRLKKRLQQTTDSKKIISLYNDLAWEYSYSQFDSAWRYAGLALQLAQDRQDLYGQAVALEMQALLKEIAGRASEAAASYMQVIKLREQLGGEGLENTYNNLGILFKKQENHRKALEYFRKSYRIEQQHGNYEGMAASLNNIATLMAPLGYPDSARYYIDRAIALARDHQLEYILQNAYINLADYFISHNQPDSALYYCRQIIDRGQSMPVKSEVLIVALQDAADIYLAQQQYRQSLACLDSIAPLLPELNNLDYWHRYYGSRAAALAGLGQHKLAYEYAIKERTTRDSLLNLQSVKVLHDLEQKYQTEKKERQIAQLEVAKIRSDQERNLFIFGFILTGIGALFLFVVISQKTKTNKLISRSLREKEVLLREIHHRVKNNLQIITSLLNLQAKFITDPQALQAINESKTRVKAMALIHQKLYQKDNLTGIDMPGFIKSLAESLLDSFGVKPGDIDLSLDIAPVVLEVDKAMSVGLILNELVSNSLKYAYINKTGTNRQLMIALHEKEGQLILMVKDNGSGFGRETGGYGLRLIKSLARKLQAEFSIDSSAGTTCTLTMTNFRTK